MATSVQFYHLTTSPLERALPKLLEKILAGGFKVALVADDNRIDALNQLLWTYDPGSFLPHGSMKDGNVGAQPVLLTTKIEAPNHANVLLVTNGAAVDDTDAFDKVLDMFDGNDTQALEAARARWTQYKNAGHTLSYLQQSEQGGWQQKAAA